MLHICAQPVCWLSYEISEGSSVVPPCCAWLYKMNSYCANAASVEVDRHNHTQEETEFVEKFGNPEISATRERSGGYDNVIVNSFACTHVNRM